jgi:pyridine nucleotide-disulfide oxidoreductase family protein
MTACTAPAAGQRRLLLVGAGHAHAEVLRQWAMAPVPGVALTLLTPSPQAPYSGMVPGWLAGHYRFDEIAIDFAALAQAAGATLHLGSLAELDPAARCVHLHGGGRLGYDTLSLNVGSTLNPPAVPGAHVLSLRPLGELHAAWEQLQHDLTAAGMAGEAHRPGAGAGVLRVRAVGGGAAGAESLLAVLWRLRRRLPQRRIEAALVTRSAEVLPGQPPAAARAMARELQAQGVRLELARDFDPGTAAEGELLLWATGAEAHGWQRRSGLAVDAAGFLQVDATLRSVSHPEVFAVGDCAAFVPPLPKAGVWAVRMGPVLARNLQAACTGADLSVYRPQRHALALLALGDRRAVATRGPWSLGAGWSTRWARGALWRWKDRIDRGFIRRYATPATPLPAAVASTAAAPQGPGPPGDPAGRGEAGGPRS